MELREIVGSDRKLDFFLVSLNITGPFSPNSKTSTP